MVPLIAVGPRGHVARGDLHQLACCFQLNPILCHIQNEVAFSPIK